MKSTYNIDEIVHNHFEGFLVTSLFAQQQSPIILERKIDHLIAQMTIQEKVGPGDFQLSVENLKAGFIY